MIINKDFDAFKNIVEDKERSKILFRPPNWFYYLIMFKTPWKETLVEQDKITISFVSGKYIYNADFIRAKETNEIEIKNSKAGAVFWSFLNSYIFKRVIRNWDKANL